MAQVNFRVDDKLKSDVEALYKGLGLTLSAAFTLFAHQSLIHRGLPFQVREDISAEYERSAERREIMKELAACSRYAREHNDRLSGDQVFGGIRERIHAGRSLYGRVS